MIPPDKATKVKKIARKLNPSNDNINPVIPRD